MVSFVLNIVIQIQTLLIFMVRKIHILGPDTNVKCIITKYFISDT